VNVRSALRWLPSVALALLLSSLWFAFLGTRGMSAVVGWLLLMAVVPFLGAAVLAVTLGYAAFRRRLTPPIVATLGLAVVLVWPGLWNLGLLQLRFPGPLEEATPAATVRLPADGRLRVAWGGDRLAKNQHAFTPDQRWAYDLLVEPYLGGSDKVEDYGCWGVPVVAPASARVHLSHDGEPDERPGAPSRNYQKPLGNFVALELETKTFLILAHLQRGSVQVTAGETVIEGQPLGACGNSGNTSEPHIHLHHQRQDPAKFPVNFAEGLPLFFRDHDGPPMPEGGVAVSGERVSATGALVRHLGAPR
jgi:hypothetical protein